jgi:DNA-binding MarR family transcriptional regulator
MREQQQHSAAHVQKLRVTGPILTPGSSIRAATEKIGMAPQPFSGIPVPDTSSNKNLQANTLNDFVRGALRKPTVVPSENFPVRRDESWELFGLFMNAVLADAAVTRMRPPAEVPREISPKLVRALLYLAQHGGRTMTVGELAEGIGVSLGWASRVADELVSLSLLERVRNENDRRVVQLQLTPGAAAVTGRLWSDREGAIVSALGEVALEDRPIIARFLRRLTTELETHAGKGSSNRS